MTEEGPVIAALSGGACDKVVLDIAHGQAVVRERQLVVVNVIEVGWEKALEESEDDALTNSEKILDQAKKDSKKLIIEMNDRYHKSAEIKKKSAETKIAQMKEDALKEIREASVNIAIESVKKVISTSVDKSKLDVLFEKNLEEAKTELKKVNS